MSRLAVWASLLAGVALAGCGGGSERASPEEVERPPEVVAEPVPFSERLSTICLELLTDVEALGIPDTAETAVTFLRRTNELGQESFARMRELTPPDELAGRFTQMIDLYEQANTLNLRAAEALGAGDAAQVEALIADQTNLGKQADAIAVELGADGCTKWPFQGATPPPPE